MKILAIAPHPDDETLGCGGSLFRHKKEGDKLSWLIVTSMHEKNGWAIEKVNQRNDEISKVSDTYQFEDIFTLEYPTTKVDTFPISDLIDNISNIVIKVSPEIIYMPFVLDAHTDHQVVATAINTSIKWFRYPSIKKVLMYETPSETGFNFITDRAFHPNVFVNISQYLDDKIKTMKIFASEIDEHPFPRSEKVIQALATLRGSQSGYQAAEAFELVYQRS